jgi:large subunit ribosomal protein L13
MGTQFPSGKNIKREWYVLDAQDAVLGRLASKAAGLLMGKHKPVYTPFLDMGDHVVVINAAKVRLTGRKEEQKVYRRHTGYPGGLIEVSARNMRAKSPARILELAIAGMLPKTKLGKHMIRKLNVYAGDRHPHQAQKPVQIPATGA